MDFPSVHKPVNVNTLQVTVVSSTAEASGSLIAPNAPPAPALSVQR